jgi:cob(I)alamin adenosyltransferase
MGEAEETVDLEELTKELVEKARREEREIVLQAQKQLFDIKTKEHELEARKRKIAEEQIKHLNEHIDELEANSAKYINIISRAANQVETSANQVEELVAERKELQTKLEEDQEEITLLRKYLDECENRGVIDYVNTLALDRVAAAAALLLGTAAATASAVV